MLYKITGDKNLQLDIAASTYSSSTISGTTAYTGSSVLDRQQIGLKINKSLLDGKVIITFGGDFRFWHQQRISLAKQQLSMAARCFGTDYFIKRQKAAGYCF